MAWRSRSPPWPAAKGEHDDHDHDRRAGARAGRAAYANKLRDAGVAVTAVRYQGIIHDFVMLNALRETHAADAAIRQAIAFLSEALAAR